MAKLQNIVTTEEKIHFLLVDGVSPDLDCYGDVDLYLKLRIKDRSMPVTLQILNDSEKRKDLTMYLSVEC